MCTVDQDEALFNEASVPKYENLSAQANRTYPLNRNYTATTRLNCQHFFWKMELGFLLHPSVLSTLLAARPPLTHVGEVLDSTFSAPLLYQIPAAADADTFRVADLATVIRGNDPRPIIRNALRMLKRGGYLQWDELDPWGAYTVVAGERNEDGLRTEFQKKQELTAMSTLQWVKDFHSIMEEVGFEDVNREKIACDIRLAKYYQDMQFLVMEEQAANEATEDGMKVVKDAIKEVTRDSHHGRRG
ncbi:MAG: hypothetical protein Q9218_005446 [Villophora microphyllina]